ncbi:MULTISPECIES: 2-polyprenylphenol 6-hydroxylase [unclassified Paracoccus (in: a-proteobacteria)]|uniref:2-polyprenylphenol 6-hydroxylase n=1 Tax=unclassified Paracoccus (in: a-proteobacteria) TaxID=2688777 RepID=UPI0012B1AC2C|nr:MULTISPECIES: 2-polyprenylphenol 6-hydroxylase [unclassified Paracoccus (in: a-proteobacteria)]UXU74914.1 2-polyprenylphenol 6-hydroxylase [Paracoccus sp. SMMA_5]UXU80817.1 2-polyprenylphenol 6-hydroxylase [Paracoccus sp. SMMA_5_TC]
MRGPHNVWRLIRTGATFERTGAMRAALDAVNAPARVRLAARVLGWPFAWLGYRGDPALPPVTRAITALGPAYIKFGQILSTRPDVVGVELADQLTMLQDRLPPFDQAQALQTIQAELGRPAHDLFSTLSEPVAAASIAQVHRARRADNGREVAVKVLRPGIEAAFRRDIDAFHFAAGMIERLSPATRRLRPRDVVAHFESVVMGELDLRLEAASASEFAENTAADTGMKVPRPHWHLSARRVLTTDWAEGLPMGDVAALRAAGHDLPELAARVLQMFLRHALRDGYFHADMHQGNLKVAPDGDIIIYDFGIMGEIDEYTRRVYAEILMGFIRRDYDRVARVHFEAGYVPGDRDIKEFSRALRAVGEPIFGADASQISMANLLAYLFEVTERFGMATRTELILLQRTMVVVEGVARSLDPQINMWQVARPVVESYIRDNLGPRAAARDLARSAQVLARFAPLLPEFLEQRLPQVLREKSAPPAQPPRQPWLAPMLSGAALALIAVALGAWLG